ncbi:MAG: AraC family transcriptional regulator [Acidobacteria bacterium]|nr:AraC family transcriptional regulator [Acidobacteriota bacterium]
MPSNPLQLALVRKISSAIGTEEKLTTPIPGLSFHRRTACSEPCSASYEPSIAVIVQGRKRVELGRNTLIYDSSRYLLTSLDLPIVSHIIEASEAKPWLALLLKLDMSVVRELLGRGEIAPHPALADTPAMATARVTAEFLGACARLVNLLDSPADIPFLSSLIQNEIIYRVLQGEAGARLRSIATLGDQSQRTAKAVAWIKTNYALPLRVDDLAHLAGMGVSTLHHHFRALTAMSPLQYQKQIRLHEARNRMLSGGLDAASAAYEVGYESPSQFSREYCRFFGQPPMRDIRALRSSGAVAEDSTI